MINLGKFINLGTGRTPSSGTKKLHLDKKNLTHICILHWTLKGATIGVLIETHPSVFYRGLKDKTYIGTLQTHPL